MNREEAEKILTHGEWFYVSLHGNYYALVKKDEIIFIRKDCLKIIKGVWIHDGEKLSESVFCYLESIKELRPATQEEVLKYFPDEVLPEPIPQRKRPITRNKKQYILR